MVLTFTTGGLRVSKTFTNPSNTYIADGYSGGIPAGETLDGADQGVIVYYKELAGTGDQVIEWTIDQYIDGSTYNRSFKVKVFLVKAKGTASDDSSKSDKTRYA